MFNRPETTYNLFPGIEKAILQDLASPLKVMADIIETGSKVLDIGAGNGLLARVLQEHHNNTIVIDGIEPCSYAAEMARSSYRNFYEGYAQDFLEIIWQEHYDFIVMADVLEHMTDPFQFLTELVKVITPKTKIITSIPNVAFGTIRLALLHGDFKYVDSGILEKTHVRFFTLQTIQDLVNNTHLNMDELYHLQRNLFSTEVNINQYNLNPLVVRSLLKDELASTYQFLLVLGKEKSPTKTYFVGQPVKFKAAFKQILKTKGWIKK